MFKQKLTAPALVKLGQGILYSIEVNSSMPNTRITFWDNTTPSEKLILSHFTLPARKYKSLIDLQFTTALFVEIDGEAEIEVVVD